MTHCRAKSARPILARMENARIAEAKRLAEELEVLMLRAKAADLTVLANIIAMALMEARQG